VKGTETAKHRTARGRLYRHRGVPPREETTRRRQHAQNVAAISNWARRGRKHGGCRCVASAATERRALKNRHDHVISTGVSRLSEPRPD
jgi:hypothetical protein